MNKHERHELWLILAILTFCLSSRWTVLASTKDAHIIPHVKQQLYIRYLSTFNVLINLHCTFLCQNSIG